MKIKLPRLFQFFLIMLFLASCIPQNKLEYLQDPVLNSKNYHIQDYQTNIIKPNDELFIKVSSFDDLSYNYFEADQSYSRVGFSNELSITLISYTVNDSGNINFPVVGAIYVKGLTLDELKLKLEDLLKDYFNQPTIIVKFAYKKITVIGEVNQPGSFIYTKEHINIFEALGMAGDLTVHGNIKKVYLLREKEVNGEPEISKYVIDLSDDNLIFSNYYNLQPDDVIYVNPRKSARWAPSSVAISTIFSTITTILSLTTTIMTISNNSNQ